MSNDMTQWQPKLCPFCKVMDIFPEEKNPASFSIRCRNCRASGPEAGTIGEACLQWNRSADRSRGAGEPVWAYWPSFRAFPGHRSGWHLASYGPHPVNGMRWRFWYDGEWAIGSPDMDYGFHPFDQPPV